MQKKQKHIYVGVVLKHDLIKFLQFFFSRKDLSMQAKFWCAVETVQSDETYYNFDLSEL